MDWKKFLYPLLVGIVIIILVWYISDKIGKGKYHTEISPILVDTVWTKPDTLWNDKWIKAKQVPAKIDTVWENGKPVEVAVSDTVIEIDSSKIWAVYYGSPHNYFDIYAKIKEKIITQIETITKIIPPEPETFWDRWGISAQAGYGYGVSSKQLEPYIGIGIHYKIK
jgi:hypothetical protein